MAESKNYLQRIKAVQDILRKDSLQKYYQSAILGFTILKRLCTPILTLWLNDINGRYWSQLLASPSNQIEISRYRKYSEFREDINIDTAIECFRKPYMW